MSLLSPNLEAFLAVVKNQTVHGAAKTIGLTQTGVTQRIRALEKDLGATLFLRSRKGMKLTFEGEALYRYCLGALELEGLALSQLKGLDPLQQIQIKILGPSSIMNSRVVPACIETLEKFTNLNLDFGINDSPHLIEQLRLGLAQFVIVRAEEVPNEMESKLLKPEKFVLVGSRKWKNRKLSEILDSEKIIDFDESDQTTFRYLKKYSLFEKSNKRRSFANGNEAIIQLFKAGVGFGTLTLEVAESHLDSGELILLNQKMLLEDALALAWYARPFAADYFKEIIRNIK